MASADWGAMLVALSALAGRVLLSVIFIHAGVQKVRHHAQLAGVISNYRLLPAALVPVASWLLPPVELAIGIALLVPSSWSALGAACLLVGFSVAIITNLARGRIHIDCGCFQSELRQELGWGLVVRNGALLAVAAHAALFPVHPPLLLCVPAVLFGLVSYVLYQALNALAANGPALRSLAVR
jgi:uncharacterized membrane protein YphA (DoxX/SURF4 family)